MKAFFACPEIPMEEDAEAVPYYFLHGYVPGPATFYKDVRQLEPGTVMTVDADGRTASRRYWRLEYPRAAEVKRVPAADAAAGVRERLTRAVERRLVSDVPLGAFLSGGLDSTIVVGLMSRLIGAPVKTFTIGFEGDAAYDETAYARLAAKRFGTDHTEFQVSPSAVDLIDRLVWHHDGPFGDSSAVPTFIVSQLARQHVTVALTGDGGDEVFAGYRRFIAAVQSERVPRAAAVAAGAFAAALPSPAHERSRLSEAKRFFSALRLPFDERITMWNAVFFADLPDLLRPELLRAVRPIDHLHYLAGERAQLDGRSTLSRLLHANFASYLPDDLLVKTDRCSMASALEARSPFLDRELVEYVAALPDAFKLDGRRTKAVLRDAFADLVPADIERRSAPGSAVTCAITCRPCCSPPTRAIARPFQARSWSGSCAVMCPGRRTSVRSCGASSATSDGCSCCQAGGEERGPRQPRHRARLRWQERRDDHVARHGHDDDHERADRLVHGLKRSKPLREALNEERRLRGAHARGDASSRAVDDRRGSARADDRLGIPPRALAVVADHFDAPRESSSTLNTVPFITYRSVVSVNGAPAFIMCSR
jgi:asparagine synthase (glutamine-hydrolysing)